MLKREVSVDVKVCLVTWLGRGNYGTSLQSYALHRKLQDIGCEVCFLPYFNPLDFSLAAKIKRYLSWPWIFLKNLLRLTYSCLKGPRNARKFNRFNKDNYNVRRVSTKRQYDTLLEHVDVFVSGSDQIWNCYNAFQPFYFLSFAGGVKRVAYASSMGTADLPKERESDVQVLLAEYSHIGVREETAVVLLKGLLGRPDVRQVVDPTILLDEEHWQGFAEKAELELDVPDNFILCYFVGSESCTSEQISEISGSLGINNVLVIPAMENSDISFPNAQVYRQCGPYEFVNLISRATYVCTDSFHATTISILFKKNFIEFLRFKDGDAESQNSRIYDLLRRYGLMDRLYKPQDDTLFNSIDYVEVTRILEKDRNDCLAYLTNSLEC